MRHAYRLYPHTHSRRWRRRGMYIVYCIPVSTIATTITSSTAAKNKFSHTFVVWCMYDGSFVRCLIAAFNIIFQIPLLHQMCLAHYVFVKKFFIRFERFRVRLDTVTTYGLIYNNDLSATINIRRAWKARANAPAYTHTLRQIIGIGTQKLKLQILTRRSCFYVRMRIECTRFEYIRNNVRPGKPNRTELATMTRNRSRVD